MSTLRRSNHEMRGNLEGETVIAVSARRERSGQEAVDAYRGWACAGYCDGDDGEGWWFNPCRSQVVTGLEYGHRMGSSSTLAIG